jgi:hypothetical protein
VTADKPQPATTGTTRLRSSTHRTISRRIEVANKRKHELTKCMIAPTARCHSLCAEKHETVAPSPSLGRDSSVGIAARHRLDSPRLEPRWGARFSSPVQTGLGAYPTFCTMNTGTFRGGGGKLAGAWCWPPTPSSAEVKQSVEMYFTVFWNVHFDIHMK